MAADGLTTLPSTFGAKETIDRLEAEIKPRGMTVFARMDHAAGAVQIGLSLRHTEVLIFGKVWLSYNEPSWLAKRHGLGAESQPTVEGMATGLSTLARKAAGP